MEIEKGSRHFYLIKESKYSVWDTKFFSLKFYTHKQFLLSKETNKVNNAKKMAANFK